MIDYSEMRRKFRAKNPELAEARQKSQAAVKRIAREYEHKRRELGLAGGRVPKRGPAYYAVLVLVMAFLAASFIALMTGRVSLGKKRISKAAIQARQSVDALSVALGRYRFHCGAYPTDGEGLAALAALTPQKKGWAGPYVKKIVPDPWGEDYVYWTRAGEEPVLMSKGPDRRLGTDDDVLSDPKLFAEPFRDTTWTNHWAPYQYRGILVAPDRETAEKWRAAAESF